MSVYLSLRQEVSQSDVVDYEEWLDEQRLQAAMKFFETYPPPRS